MLLCSLLCDDVIGQFMIPEDGGSDRGYLELLLTYYVCFIESPYAQLLLTILTPK